MVGLLLTFSVVKVFMPTEVPNRSAERDRIGSRWGWIAGTLRTSAELPDVG